MCLSFNSRFFFELIFLISISLEIKKVKLFLKSFKYCFEGMRYAFYTEQNIIVMFVIAIISLILGIFLKINYTERLVIVLLIGIVMSLEMVNCAIEATVDLVTEEKKPMAKVAKDCASGAVGIISIIALIIGIMIFLPKIIALF